MNELDLFMEVLRPLMLSNPFLSLHNSIPLPSSFPTVQEAKETELKRESYDDLKIEI